MGKTKEFDEIFNTCLEQLLAGGSTVEGLLVRYPEQAAELRPLLETALIAGKASQVTPRPEFRARASREFRHALAERQDRKGFTALAWPRWATIVAIALVLLTLGGGTVGAAGNSLPDSPLYVVKLATEQVQLALAGSDISKAELHTRLAERRVSEMVSIADTASPEEMQQVTERLENHLLNVSALARAGTREEKALLTMERAQAPAPSPAPVPKDTPPSQEGVGDNNYTTDTQLERLRTAIAQNAVRHPDVLRQMLITAPESLKPAIRQAIAMAEIRYQQALEAVTELTGGGQ